MADAVVAAAVEPQPQPAGDPKSGTSEGVDPQKSQTQAADQRPGADKSGDAANRGILADLVKERKARQAVEERLKQLEAGQQQRDQRLREAITGETAIDPEIQAIRDQFAQIFPGLAKLTDEQIDKLVNFTERSDDLEATADHYWSQQGQSMLSGIEQGVLDKLGGDKLSDRQIKAIHRFYVGEVENDRELLHRHMAGDPKLVEEIVTAVLEDWYEPARRSLTATEVERAGKKVPAGRGGHVLTSNKPTIDVNDPKQFAAALVQGFKESGGEFGRGRK